jgi:hypothetical protein
MYSLNIHRSRYRAVLFGFFIMVAAAGFSPAALAEEEVYGPVNLLKTMPNPFNGGLRGPGESDAVEELGMIELSATGRQPRRSLNERLNGPRLFLPDRMVLGRVSEFLVKGPPGCSVAVAMADKNKGAKPIVGHAVRLGADRKVVAVGKIPDTGVISVFIESPIQGDLVGSSLYFEAAVWSKPDFSDTTLCSCVTPLHTGSDLNGVTVTEELDAKKPGVFTFAPSKIHYASEGASGPGSGTPY